MSNPWHWFLQAFQQAPAANGVEPLLPDDDDALRGLVDRQIQEITIQEEVLRSLRLLQDANALRDQLVELREHRAEAADRIAMVEVLRQARLCRETQRLRESKRALEREIDGLSDDALMIRYQNSKNTASLNAIRDRLTDDTQPPLSLQDLEKLRAKTVSKLKKSFANRQDREDYHLEDKRIGYRHSIASVEGSLLTPGLDEILVMVPSSHLVHDHLRSLSVVPVGEYDGDSVGAYNIGNRSIQINVAGVQAHPVMEYVLEGRAASLPTLQATVLHEVGHAVDAAAGIMANVAMADLGTGGWADRLEVAEVAEAFLAEVHNIPDGRGEEAREILLAALGGTGQALPEGLEMLGPTQQVCLAMAQDNRPWRNLRQAGERCYFQDNGTWRSYARAAWDQLSVRAYQWRAPGEWFAEVYAVSWSLRRPIPHVSENVARYLFREV